MSSADAKRVVAALNKVVMVGDLRLSSVDGNIVCAFRTHGSPIKAQYFNVVGPNALAVLERLLDELLLKGFAL